VPALAQLRVELFFGVTLVLLTILTGRLGQAWAARSPVFQRLAWLSGFILASIPLVTWPGSVLRFHLETYFKCIFFFVATVALIDSEKKLKWFLLVFVGCQLFRVIEPLYLHLASGYWGDSAYSFVGGDATVLDRLSGAPHDIVNPNQLAWVIVSMVPFIYYLGLKSGKVLLAALCIPAFVAMGYALMLTGSRSGMVCLAVVVLSIGWFGQGRINRLLLMSIFLVPLVIFAGINLETDMATRYESLIDQSLVGGDTAKGRVEGLIKNLQTVSGNPLFGHGLGTSSETNFNIHGGRGQISHNLYVEALQEIGVIGFVLLLLYIKSIWVTLLRTYELVKDTSPFLRHVVQATIVWVVMDVIYSLSCFGLSSWEWYFFGGVTTVCCFLGEEVSVEHGSPDRKVMA